MEIKKLLFLLLILSQSACATIITVVNETTFPRGLTIMGLWGGNQFRVMPDVMPREDAVIDTTVAHQCSFVVITYPIGEDNFKEISADLRSFDIPADTENVKIYIRDGYQLMLDVGDGNLVNVPLQDDEAGN